MDAVITVNGLCKRYGSTCAVDGISFEVARGEIFGLLGRNGAGKTTTVECLQGLRHADDGEIVVAMIDDEATVKRVYFEGDRIRFQPSNPRMAPIYVREEDFRRSRIVAMSFCEPRSWTRVLSS